MAYDVIENWLTCDVCGKEAVYYDGIGDPQVYVNHHECNGRLTEAEQAIKRVRELHTPDEYKQCTACCEPDDPEQEYLPCIAISSPWPCETIRALDQR